MGNIDYPKLTLSTTSLVGAPHFRHHLEVDPVRCPNWEDELDCTDALVVWVYKQLHPPSQNEFDICLPKKSCIGFIISSMSINMGFIIDQEMEIRKNKVRPHCRSQY